MLTLPQRFISLSVLVLITVAVLSGCAPKANKTVQPRPSPSEKTDSNQCTDNFTLLKPLNPSAFSKYRSEFGRINESYSYLQDNRQLMEKDPVEVMELTLKDKLNLVCDRVKSQTFSEVRQRMKVISTL